MQVPINKGKEKKTFNKQKNRITHSLTRDFFHANVCCLNKFMSSCGQTLLHFACDYECHFESQKQL